MRALLCNGSGSLEDLVVGEAPEPSAGPGQIVIGVQAASVDFVDTLIATGKYQIPVTAPFTPGNNVAGIVEQVGAGCTRFSVGDRVHGIAFIGGFAERVAVPEKALRPTPDKLTPDLACLTGTPYRTAYDALVSTAQLRAGEELVLLGASGAVGSAAILIGKVLGARVVACASTPAKLEFCRKLGADDGVLYETPSFKADLKAACNGSADVVLDMVGGELSEPALRAVGYGGRFVVVGFAAGSPARVPLNLVLLKGSIVTGYEIADFERLQPAQAELNRAALEAMLADGTLSPPITNRFTLEQAALAMAVVAGRDKFGTAILEVA